RIRPARSAGAELVSALESRAGLRESLLLAKSMPQVAMGLREIGLHFDGPVVRGYRFVEPTGLAQRVRQAVVPIGGAWVKLDDATVGFDRVVEPAGVLQRNAQIVVCSLE